MATVRISQLTAITTPTDDDVLVINDADTNTRKITFANLTQGLLNTSSVAQTKTGALTVNGTFTAAGNLVVDTDTLFVNSTADRVGINTATPNVDLDIDGTVQIRNANTLRFGDGNNSNYVALKAPTVVPADYTLTLPDSPPSVTNLLAVGTTGAIEYSIGVTYNSTDDALEASQIRLVDQGSVRFYEDIANGSEYIQFNAPVALATTNSYTLPNAFPAIAGYVLSSDLSGNMSWVSNSATAAGSPGEIQFNGGSGLSADSDLSWNAGTNTLQTVNLDLTGTLTADGNVDLGTSSTNSISLLGSIDTDVIPDATGARDLGAPGYRWAQVHANEYLADKTVTAGGTTGAQTINKVAGSVNFAAAATSLVVTNSFVTTNSVIIATVATNDTTMTSVQVVASAGSFTIHANAAATAETRVNFLVIN